VKRELETKKALGWRQEEETRRRRGEANRREHCLPAAERLPAIHSLRRKAGARFACTASISPRCVSSSSSNAKPRANAATNHTHGNTPAAQVQALSSDWCQHFRCGLGTRAPTLSRLKACTAGGKPECAAVGNITVATCQLAPCFSEHRLLYSRHAKFLAHMASWLDSLRLSGRAAASLLAMVGICLE